MKATIESNMGIGDLLNTLSFIEGLARAGLLANSLGKHVKLEQIADEVTKLRLSIGKAIV